MDLLQETLSNGASVVIKANHFSPTVAIQVWVGVGSLTEGPNERGMAHYIEHMLFKGTERRGVGEIAAMVEGAGGEINAYTTFDHTVFHLTLAGEQAALGVDLLFDAFAHSRFDPDEFDREKEVILEEIKRSADSPGAKVGRRVFELCFAGTEAGRPIIGSEASVKGFKRDELHAFYRRWYQPENIHIVIVGAIEPDVMMQTVRESFGSLPRGKMPARTQIKLPARPEIAKGTAPTVSILRGDFQQPRLEMVFPAPPLEELDSTALDLAAFALGTGEMARLTRRLRDSEGVVTSVGASVYAPLFGGIFELSAVMSEDKILDAVAGLARETRLLRDSAPVTGDELKRACANLKADRIFRDETVDGQARSLGFGMMTPLGVLYDEVYATLVNSMPDTAIAGAVTRWLKPETATIVLLVNEASTLSEADVTKAFLRGFEPDTASRKSPVRTAVTRTMREAATIVDLMPGVKLIYRQNPHVQLFTMTAATEGGLRAESEADAGVNSAISAMVATASKSTSYEKLMAEIEGKGASLEGFSGKDSSGMHVQCLIDDMPRSLQLFRECLLEPVFPEEQWVSLSREIDQVLASQNDSPAGVCVRRFQEMLFGEHPYRHSLVGTESSVKHFTAENLLSRFKTLRDGGPWIFAASAPGPAEPMADMIRAALLGFTPNDKPRQMASSKITKPGPGGKLRVTKDREQTHIVYGFNGITWGDMDRPALDVLVNVLGGHGGRLFKELRDKDSLAYTVSPIVSYGCHPGIVGSYIACAPAKADRALGALKDEMLKLVDQAPTAAEIERARSYIIGTHEMSLQKSDAQTSTMALMELYGYGFDDFLLYPSRIAAVKVEDVLRVARRLFKPDAAAEVTVGPA